MQRYHLSLPNKGCCHAGYSDPTNFEGIGFSLKKGEILGFYGLVGAGRSEFMQSLFGITKPSKGAMRIDGDIAIVRSPAEAIERGLVYVPEDRGKQGAVIGLPPRQCCKHSMIRPF